MSDLYVDGPMLERVRTNFRRIEELLCEPAQQMRAVDGTQMGPRPLVDRVNEFGEEWSYGIQQLGEFSAGVVDSLQKIAEAFEAVDADLADALNKAKS